MRGGLEHIRVPQAGQQNLRRRPALTIWASAKRTSLPTKRVACRGISAHIGTGRLTLGRAEWVDPAWLETVDGLNRGTCVALQTIRLRGMRAVPRQYVDGRLFRSSEEAYGE